METIGARVAMAAFFVLISLALNVSYLLVVVMFAGALRLGVTEYALGMGPVVLRRGAFSVRLFPVAAWFNPASRDGRAVDPDSDLGAALLQGQLRFYEDLPLAAFVGLALVSAVVAFVGSGLCLGWGMAAEATAEGLRAYVAGALSPFSAGRPLLDSAFVAYGVGGAQAFVGRALGLLGGMNFLWLPSSVMFLLGIASTGPWPRIRFLLWLLTYATQVSWLVAFLAWVLRA